MKISTHICSFSTTKIFFFTYFFPEIYYKGYIQKMANIRKTKEFLQLDDDIFYKHSKFCWKSWQKLHKHMSHFQFFCYNLKSIKEVTSLYSLRRLAQRNEVLVDFISDPFVKFFLFSFDISGKFLKLCVFSGNIKKVSHNWESYFIYNMYISTINLCNFISKLI